MATLKPSAGDLERYLKTLKDQPSRLLKRRQIQGSELCAIATAHILLQVVAKAKWTDVDSLLEKVQQIGLRLIAAQPKELVVGNIVRRVLSLIRDEAAEDRNEDISETATEAGATPTTACALAPSHP
ncbi:translation initiation factor eIF-2B subunit gamma [Colletotrichum spaethianum]|uniref:Translation initiation factor eIF2B subunit beta n=1 Tax=Colletotrichum spaethianum TaxID=700344 RepID=A0AA37LAT5_9PEZI|nr:translation initiation factor eIF-2B subunit gamma [Colletotrichum spaethianum]GKT44941.1 translation initiation factor eIF-2B subunit gamma [Colletotrichum spaethianum]